MDELATTRFLFLRALAFIYLMGFLGVVNQFRALCGENGLLPAQHFMARVPFKRTPSLFYWRFSDRLIAIVGWTGVALSLLALSGLSDRYGWTLFLLTWGLLWLFYLSFVNIGQVFYGFGWESLLLETGFLALFLGPLTVKTPFVVIYLGRWICFRLMFGAGLIKLRGDKCWWDLTCLHYHYQTQPVPSPLSWYFHQLPGVVHKACVLFTHFVELIVPWFLLAPAPLCWIAGALTVYFQFMLIVSGNLSWLNYVSIVVAIPCFDDRFFGSWVMQAGETSVAHGAAAWAYCLLVVVLSVRPVMNLFSRHQAMNASFDSLHLVNTYGAFGSVTKRRPEIILQGSNDGEKWLEYEFKAKPGDVTRMPALMSPYHYRLDWLMWFAAMSSPYHHPWIFELVDKLLQGDPQLLKLLRHNPFPDAPPRWIRAKLYDYRFSKPGSSDWWERSGVGPYIEPTRAD